MSCTVGSLAQGYPQEGMRMWVVVAVARADGVCMHIHIYVHIYISLYICVCAHTPYINIDMYVDIYMYIPCMYIHTYVYTHGVYIYIYATYIYICILYRCIYIYISFFAENQRSLRTCVGVRRNSKDTGQSLSSSVLSPDCSRTRVFARRLA